MCQALRGVLDCAPDHAGPRVTRVLNPTGAMIRGETS